MNLQKVKLSEIMKLERRPVSIEAEKKYREIGIYCFGKGIFHKTPRHGWEFEKKKIYLINKDDLIFQITFSWEGAIALASEKEVGMVGSVRYPTFVVNKDVCSPRYLLYYFKTREGLDKLGQISPGSALRNRVLNVTKLQNLEVMLPSLNDQNLLIQRYESINNKISNIRFSVLNDNIENISELRGSILTKAVQGKLAPQNPKDEPANVLLEKIKKEKERLIKDGKIKKQKPLPPITEEEIPFELSDGWGWARLGEVTTYALGLKIEPNNIDKNTWVLELEDVEKTTSKLLKKVRNEARSSKSTKNTFVKNDVVYGKLRPYLDKVIVADEKGVCTTEMIPLNGYGFISPYYLRWFLKSPYFIYYANNSTHGMNLPRLGTEKARNAVFPIPPLTEQKRIVAKVDQLLKLCDELENQLNQYRKENEMLMQAVLQEAFEGNNAKKVGDARRK